MGKHTSDRTFLYHIVWLLFLSYGAIYSFVNRGSLFSMNADIPCRERLVRQLSNEVYM